MVDDQSHEFQLTFDSEHATFISSVGKAEEDVKLVIDTVTAVEGNYTVYFIVNETVAEGEYNIFRKKFLLSIPPDFDQLELSNGSNQGSNDNGDNFADLLNY